MDYQIFIKKEEIPRKYKTYVIELDEDDCYALIVKIMRWGKSLKEIYINSTDVDMDPLKNIPEKSKIYVAEDAINLFEQLIEYSKIFNQCDGDLDKIVKKYKNSQEYEGLNYYDEYESDNYDDDYDDDEYESDKYDDDYDDEKY